MLNWNKIKRNSTRSN